MSNKVFMIWLFIVIISSTFINHKIYGNSNSTLSSYEILQDLNRKRIKKQKSEAIADYMYGRIKFYQQFNTWYESYDTFWNMYEALQNME